MQPSHDDPFSDTETTVHSPLPQTPTDGPSDVFVVKTLVSGLIVKYRAHCDPDAPLSVLRDTLHNDEDSVMSADDRFHQGGFRVGKSAEPYIKWRDILKDNVIGVLPKDLSPSSTLALDNRRTGKKSGDRTSSSLPPATVPLHLLTQLGSSARLYGNFASEKGGYSYNALWTYGGLVCRIWENREPGMVPLLRVHSPKLNTHAFLSSDEATKWWVENEDATIEFTVGYVYRSDGPCPEGAVPLYGVFDGRIGRFLTISESEKDLCQRLGAKNLGMLCYVAPP